MAETADIFEIEIDDPECNSCLLFMPVQRKLRGRFDFLRVREPQARMHFDNYPQGIPGQRIRLNSLTGEASIIEPLRDDVEHKNTAEKIVSKEGSLPNREHFKDVDVATWAYWMIRAVESRNARVVRGAKPAINGKPKTNFFSNDAPSTDDKVTLAMEAQTKAFSRFAEALEKLITQK